MANLNDEIAGLLYTADSPALPWTSAVEEDRKYYAAVADVVVDTVIAHLRGLQIPTDAICEYLEAGAEVGRLKRLATS